MKMVQWIEPFGDSQEEPYSYILRMIPADEAIKRSKESAFKINPTFIHANDEQALEDFLTIHWADIVEIDDPTT